MYHSQSDSAVPLYKRIYIDIKEQIKNQTLLPEQKLPPEKFLCEKYQVSRITIRKALELLTRENLVTTVHGKGTYVNSKKMMGKLNQVQGFSEFALARDKDNQQVILKREITKNKEAAQKLLLPPDTDLIYIKRIFKIDDKSIAINKSWLSAKRFPNLLVDFTETTSLYDYLKHKYNEIATDSYRELSVILPSSEQKRLLKLTKTVPLFEVTKTAYDQLKQPLEFSHYVVRGDEMTYTFDSTSDSQFHLSKKQN
ncbi:GntR family transcriptional regulator [Lactobacillus sp. ESL0731]|uniref:GntR family transcriptional regulator n=1 Tax=unclassified Lactobacillus TaxID=2620435 RepID=UPI0023F6EEF8|nr:MULTISPECIES: GntR family transcriptional regulator [unclassified Lactobacillus]WEV51583.1 GntR family transcriptional regulator [Lactobacillus sp. ESL0700]WEV62712.1 GntR family transcriptional regulator [Lactobacillus sp. ESL0731]